MTKRVRKPCRRYKRKSVSRLEGCNALKGEGTVMQDKSLDRYWWALRLTYGVVPIVAGLDKFTNLLVDWTQYLSPLALDVVPVSASTFMMVVGVIEVLAGVLVLSRYTRIGAYVVGAWLVAIALNLLTTGSYLDVAVRDLAMSVSAFILAKMSEARSKNAARGEETAPTHVTRPRHAAA
jgi:uncharacterized membrane protein YphA (DoxX/SURF4 family)